MASAAKNRSNAKYDAANTKHYGFKLNTKTDADIIAKLSSVDNLQGYIKSVIRADLASKK